MSVRIDVTTEPITSEPVNVYVNGRLATTVVIDQALSRDTLEAELRSARAATTLVSTILPGLLESAAKAHKTPDEGMTPEKKKEAWARGLVDGLSGLTAGPHPTQEELELPGYLRETSLSYEAGWRYGDAIRRATEIATEDLREEYCCGCIRVARWERCRDHADLDHDEEPPPQYLDTMTTATREHE